MRQVVVDGGKMHPELVVRGNLVFGIALVNQGLAGIAVEVLQFADELVGPFQGWRRIGLDAFVVSGLDDAGGNGPPARAGSEDRRRGHHTPAVE